MKKGVRMAMLALTIVGYTAQFVKEILESKQMTDDLIEESHNYINEELDRRGVKATEE